MAEEIKNTAEAPVMKKRIFSGVQPHSDARQLHRRYPQLGRLAGKL